MALPDTDWLGFCRRAGAAAREAVGAYSTRAERSVETGRGEGGDMAYVIDRASEDAIFAELDALGVPLTAVSEERGEVSVHGGGTARVVIDPVDGSVNAKRGLPFACVSIAVASGAAHGGRRGRLGRRARPIRRSRGSHDARLVGGSRRGGLRLRPAPAGARAGAARDARRGDGPARAGGGRRAGAGEGRGAPDPRPRLCRLEHVPGGRRPARRDGQPARGPLRRRRGRPAARDASAADRWPSRAATPSTSTCARTWRRPARRSWWSGCWVRSCPEASRAATPSSLRNSTHR